MERHIRYVSTGMIHGIMLFLLRCEIMTHNDEYTKQCHIYIVMVTIKLSLKVNFFTIRDQVIVNFS